MGFAFSGVEDILFETGYSIPWHQQARRKDGLAAAHVDLPSGYCQNSRVTTAVSPCRLKEILRLW